MTGHCLIVGVGPGLGLSIARRFSARGFRTGLVARRADRLAGYCESLKADGVTSRAEAADVTDRGGLGRAIDALVAANGAPDVLVYNAFAKGEGLASEMTVDAMMENVRINAGGAINTLQLALPHMRKTGARSGKRAILISGGGAAIDVWPTLAPLGAGKSALRNFSLNLAGELKDEGVHVATVTICQHIKSGTRFDPDRIAAVYTALYDEQPDAWRAEVVYR